MRNGAATSLATALLGSALAALAACTQSSGTASASADPTAIREQRSVDALRLKQRYKDIVMGSEVKGETLVLYIDVNNLYSMDEQAEDAMRSQTLAQWAKIWAGAHPRKHMKLRLSLRDYYGNEVTGDTARV